MKSYFIVIILLLALSSRADAQGCVAIRSVGGLGTMDHGNDSSQKKWLLNINNRYFNSYKHFVGDVEQKQRVEAGTQVINHAYTMDVAVTRILNNRWSVSADVPIISNTRSSLYEHGGKERHTTASFGLGDIRVSASYWLLNPLKHSRGNVARTGTEITHRRISLHRSFLYSGGRGNADRSGRPVDTAG
jgi:hypothetical protein